MFKSEDLVVTIGYMLANATKPRFQYDEYSIHPQMKGIVVGPNEHHKDMIDVVFEDEHDNTKTFCVGVHPHIIQLAPV